MPPSSCTRPAAAALRRPWRPFSATRARQTPLQPADDPNWVSRVDNPPQLVRAGQKKSWGGFVLLALMPVTAFGLGTWQIVRLRQKTDLLSRLEDRIARRPLGLTPAAAAAMAGDDDDDDPDAGRLDYCRIALTGRFRHNREMLLGPRMRDGERGYMVITPLEDSTTATDGGADCRAPAVLVNRGWIAHRFADPAARADAGLPADDVTVEGMVRKPWRRNLFSPANNPATGEFLFPDVDQMANLAGASPVWIEQTTEPDMLDFMLRKSRGIPIPREATVDVRNNHAQYIFTWYGLSLATSIMLYMLARRPPSSVAQRVRMNRSW